MLEIKSREQSEQALRSSRQIMIEKVQWARQLSSGARSIMQRIQRTGWATWTEDQIQRSLDGADDAVDAILTTSKILVEAKIVGPEQIEGIETRHALVVRKLQDIKSSTTEAFSKRDPAVFSSAIFAIATTMEAILDMQAIASELRNVWVPPAPAAPEPSAIPAGPLPAPPLVTPAQADEAKPSVWPWVAAGGAALFLIPGLAGMAGPVTGFALGMAALNPKRRVQESRIDKIKRMRAKLLRSVR